MCLQKKGQTYECVLEGRENLLLGMSDVDKEIGAMFFEDAKGKAEDLNESTIMHGWFIFLVHACSKVVFFALNLLFKNTF